MNTHASTSRASLAAQQQALLALLFDPPHPASAPELSQAGLRATDALAQRGLQAYRANGHALAERALAAAFPVVSALLGSKSFDQLARAFWHRHPPERGDLAEWGDRLPAFVQADAALAELPYLADVARLEWALHRATLAPDAEADPASFARLGSEDPACLGLRLAPGTVLLPSAYPVASIVLAHGEGGPDFDTVGQRLRGGVAETALVWRAGLRPVCRALTSAEAAFVAALLAPHSLPQALDAAAAAPPDVTPLDLGVWLADAVQSGLLLGVQDLPTEHSPAKESHR